jgi:hypothetical protein
MKDMKPTRKPVRTSTAAFLKKADLVNKPVICEITDLKDNNFGNPCLVLLTPEGEQELTISNADVNYLMDMFGDDFEKLEDKKQYTISAKDTNTEFNGYKIFELVVTE